MHSILSFGVRYGTALPKLYSGRAVYGFTAACLPRAGGGKISVYFNVNVLNSTRYCTTCYSTLYGTRGKAVYV